MALVILDAVGSQQSAQAAAGVCIVTGNGDKELAAVWQSKTSDVELRLQWRKGLAQAMTPATVGSRQLALLLVRQDKNIR